MLLEVTIADYRLVLSETTSAIFEGYREHARAVLIENQADGANDESMPLFVAVVKGHDWPLLMLELRANINPWAGFYPGVLLVPETGVLFIGSGEHLSAYQLEPPTKLWDDKTNFGFWNWTRHGNYVLMSAELELGAWDVNGKKLWSTFVEPPWGYEVESDTIVLDVMGKVTAFSIEEGPTRRT